MTRRTTVIESPRDTLQALEAWGFDASWQNIWNGGAWPGVPGRVTADHGEFLQVAALAEHGGVTIQRAVPAGKLRHHSTDRQDLPQVGDYVALDPTPGLLRVTHVLPRRTALLRRNPGDTIEAQVMVANLHRIFILASMNQPMNPGRLERSLALAWDSGADPVIALTKFDLAINAAEQVRDAEAVAMGVPVLPVSVWNGTGLAELDARLQPHETVALLGPSGVGKSTLINYWLGERRQKVQAIRSDDGRGRHTTTHREIFPLPHGALVVDIPGVRELGLWDGGTDIVFADIDALAASCRFTDCQHEGEPGCAVEEAMAQGQLDTDRLQQYRKMERELQHLDRARGEARQIWKQRSKDARQRARMRPHER